MPDSGNPTPSGMMKVAIWGGDINVLNEMIPSSFDEVDLSYSGDNITQAVFKEVDVTKAIITFTYSGDNIINAKRT